MGVIADKIRRAIFGGEVRDSIADGIEVVEQLREDYDNQVINAGNSNAEIVDARGGQAKLKDRLDKFNEQLDIITNEKADINKGVFSSPTLTVVQKMEVLTEATRLCGSEVGRKYIVIQAPDSLDISIAEGWGDVLDDNGAIYETLPAGKEAIFTSKSPIWAKATEKSMVLIKKEVNL